MEQDKKEIDHPGDVENNEVNWVVVGPILAVMVILMILVIVF